MVLVMRLRENRIVVTGRSANLSQAPVIAWILLVMCYGPELCLEMVVVILRLMLANAYLLTSYPNQVSLQVAGYLHL
jgi:hypothetical protein